MAIKCGFFNDVSGDRLYNADDMNMPYKRLISNGVIPNPVNALQVTATTGLTVNIAAGGGLFGDKWAEADGSDAITLDSAHSVLNRIDYIVMRSDINNSVREVYLDKITGTPASIPVAPTLERSAYIKEYALAKINVAAGATTLTNADIIDTREDSTLCGYTTNLINSNYLTQVITLNVSDWAVSGDKFVCSKTVTGVTAVNNVIVGAAPESIENYIYYGLVCVNQSINTLRFEAVAKPTAAITINVMIL